VLTSLIKYNLNILSLAFIYCKKCGEYRYLTPHAFWNISDLGVKCKNCGTINRITLEDGEVKNKNGLFFE
jgi:RNase P subunit RPR2